MNRLTVDERRRTNELRRLNATVRGPHAVTAHQLAHQAAAPNWGRNARVASLITLVLGGALVLLQLAQTLSLYGPGSLLDWLLPRL
jgi:hypothetical protein